MTMVPGHKVHSYKKTSLKIPYTMERMETLDALGRRKFEFLEEQQMRKLRQFDLTQQRNADGTPKASFDTEATKLSGRDALRYQNFELGDASTCELSCSLESDTSS